jgi:type II secretory pathway pseudopilin PulG
MAILLVGILAVIVAVVMTTSIFQALVTTNTTESTPQIKTRITSVGTSNLASTAETRNTTQVTTDGDGRFTSPLLHKITSPDTTKDKRSNYSDNHHSGN